jgi:hypothetical protein
LIIFIVVEGSPQCQIQVDQGLLALDFDLAPDFGRRTRCALKQYTIWRCSAETGATAGLFDCRLLPNIRSVSEVQLAQIAPNFRQTDLDHRNILLRQAGEEIRLLLVCEAIIFPDEFCQQILDKAFWRENLIRPV